jgi:hypothetical protein
MRMRRNRVSPVRPDMTYAALVAHTHGSGCTPHPRPERQANPGGTPRPRDCAEATQAGRLITHEMITATAVGNVAAMSHEVGVGAVADAVAISTASIPAASKSAAPCETAAATMEATTAVKATATSVETASATSTTVPATATAAGRDSTPTAARGSRGVGKWRGRKADKAECGSERDEASTHVSLPEDDVARATDCYHRLGG